MKRIILFALTLALGLPLFAQAGAKSKANKDTEHWRYELQPAVGQAQHGCACMVVLQETQRSNDAGR